MLRRHWFATHHLLLGLLRHLLYILLLLRHLWHHLGILIVLLLRCKVHARARAVGGIAGRWLGLLELLLEHGGHLRVLGRVHGALRHLPLLDPLR